MHGICNHGEPSVYDSLMTFIAINLKTIRPQNQYIPPHSPYTIIQLPQNQFLSTNTYKSVLMNRFDVLDATGAGDANLGRPSRQEDVDLTSKTHKCMLRIKSAESKLRKLHGEQEKWRNVARTWGD